MCHIIMTGTLTQSYFLLPKLWVCKPVQSCGMLHMNILYDLLMRSLGQNNMKYLEDLLKALLTNSLTESHKKCQLFRTELQYMVIPFYQR